MTIRIFPSRLPGDPLETHEHKPLSLHQWLSENVKNYQKDMTHPIAVEINGRPIPASEWSLCYLSSDTDVRIYPVPYATGLIIASVVIAVASAAYSIYMMNNIDKPGSGSGATGDQLDLSPAKANMINLGDPIREVFGRYRVYPDYVVQPISRFDADNPEIYRTEMMLCIGVGNFAIQPSSIRIGSTPVASFGADASYSIYGPGASVAGDSRSQNWWLSTEVGGTSSGSGLDTNSTAPGSIYVNSDAVLFNGNTITLIGVSNENAEDDSDDPSIPSSWTVGTVITVIAPDSYVISKSGGYSVIYGDFSELGPTVGDPVTLSYNDVSYDLFIASYTKEVEPIPGVGGSAASITASAAPSTYDFTTSSYTFNIIWQGVTYVVNLVTNYINMSGLVNAISDSLTGSGLEAVDSYGRVAIQEISSPYTGGKISNTTLPVAVFGSAPVNVLGTASSGGAAGVPAHVTLAYTSASGSPFSGIPVGTERLSLMYGNGDFVINAIDDTTITVDRLIFAVDGVTTVVDPAWSGFSNRTILDSSVSGEDDAENWLGPFLACPAGETTTVIENNFIFPNGHIQYKNNGDSQSHTVRVLVQYRNTVAGGAWTQVTYDFKGKTANGHGYTKRISGLAAAQYEIRVRRTTRIGGSKTVNSLYWQALRSRLSKTATRYANVTTMALTIRTGNRLASQSDRRVNLIATRLYEGSGTRTISGALKHVLNSLGMRADIQTINDLESNYWTPRGETFDFSASEDSTSALDILNKITNAGMGYFLLSDGLASAGREGIKEWTGIISPQETTEELQTAFKAASQDDYDGVDVTYINGTSWAEETVQCRTADNPTPSKVESYTLDGVLDQDRAYRIGMRRLMGYKHQRLNHSTSTELDALCYEFMDRIIFTDDIPGNQTLSCLIIGMKHSDETISLTLSEPPDWTFANPRVLIRHQDGSASALLIPTRVDDYTLTVPYSTGLHPEDWEMSDPYIEPPRLIFCSSSRVGYDALLNEIAPSSDGTCQVSATIYTPKKYQYDDASYPGDVS